MSPSRNTVRDLRRLNRQRVLRQIYFDAPISRLDVSRRLGLSPATVTSVVAELLSEGLVVESGSEESDGGRPRTLLTINPDYGFIVGVDFGETRVQLEIFDLMLHKLHDTYRPVNPTSAQPHEVVQQIDEGLEELITQTRVDLAQIIGVGLGNPGIVDIANEVLVFAPNWGWHQIPLQKMLAARLRLPIYLDNGVKAMAQAEQWFGAGQDVDDLVVLMVGTGVGASIITGRQLYRGATNSAGEWGHTSIDRNGRLCRCGSHGCLEAYVGATGIIQRLREYAPDSPLLVNDDRVVTIAAIFDAARHGDPAAGSVLQETVEYLGMGIANLINLFNPQRILLGGWVGLHFDAPLLAQVSEVTAQYALSQPFLGTTIAACKLGQDALCMGAATLVLDAFLASAGQMRRSTFRPVGALL